MSNNDQMVSVPREPTVAMLKAADAENERAILGGSHKGATAEELYGAMLGAASVAHHQSEPMKPYGYLREVDGQCQLSVGPERPADRSGGYATPWGAIYAHPPASDGFSTEQMTAEGADGYRNGIKAAAELAADYPELAQAIRDLPLPQ